MSDATQPEQLTPAPCPWCDCVVKADTMEPNAVDPTRYVYCSHCHAYGPDNASEGGAIRAWNGVALAPARLEEAKKQLRALVEAVEKSHTGTRQFDSGPVYTIEGSAGFDAALSHARAWLKENEK